MLSIEASTPRLHGVMKLDEQQNSRERHGQRPLKHNKTNFRKEEHVDFSTIAHSCCRHALNIQLLINSYIIVQAETLNAIEF